MALTKVPVINTQLDALNEHISAQNGILARMLTQNMPDEVSYKDIQLAVRNGYAKLIYPIGTQIVIPWVDKADNNKEYQMPFDVVHYGRVTLKSGETADNAMYLQSHYTLPFDTQFDHERAFLRCPNGLAAGTYYFTYVGSDYGTYLKKNTVVCFTLTQAVPEGGRIAGLYMAAYDKPQTQWRVYSYSDEKTLAETVTPVYEIADGAINLGDMQLTTRNGDLNSAQEIMYGWNRWLASAARQYLNSDADKGSWWTAYDGWDICPDHLNTKAGFAAGLPKDFLKILSECETKTAVNTVQDKADVGSEYDTTYDKIFLASLEQEYVTSQFAGVEGEYWEYWKERLGLTKPQAWYDAGINPNHIRYGINALSTIQPVRLRSASRGYAYRTWYVNRTGFVGNGYARGGNIRFCPACIIA